jgi:hypothetical protein
MNVFLYIDATTGGMALQVILSGFVGGLVFIKLFWRNLVNMVLRRQPTDDEDEPDAAPQTTTVQTDARLSETAAATTVNADSTVR